ncbi:2469_t:CDS:2 [Entrophospora sp. SA101]|nr:2469_t:CDS:2 [Entrophospora sp. SA101]
MFNQKLFVGTSTGSLLVYEIKEPLEKEPLSVNLLKLTKIFKKIIEQLNVILVALSGRGGSRISTIVTRLSVAVKKKSLIFTWKDTGFVDNKFGCFTKFCLGLANEYVLLDIGSGVLKELFSHINSGFSYMVASFSAKVNVSIFVGLDGTPIRYSYPYLVAILPNHVKIRNIVTQSLVQTIELPQPRLINQGKYLYIANNNTIWG